MNKVKRGFGLFATSAVAWVVGALTGQIHPDGFLGDLVAVLGGLAVVVMLAAFVAGLVFLAWGLATRGSRRRASDPPG